MQDSSISIWTVSVLSPRWRNQLFWTFPANTLILVQIQLPSVSWKRREHPVDDARPVADRENVPVAWLRWAFYSGMSKPSHKVSSAKLLCTSEVLECAFELSFMYLHSMCTNCTAVTGDPVCHLHRICSGNSIPYCPFSISKFPKVSGHVLLKLLMIVCMIRVYAGVHLGSGAQGGIPLCYSLTTLGNLSRLLV